MSLLDYAQRTWQTKRDPQFFQSASRAGICGGRKFVLYLRSSCCKGKPKQSYRVDVERIRASLVYGKCVDGVVPEKLPLPVVRSARLRAASLRANSGRSRKIPSGEPPANVPVASSCSSVARGPRSGHVSCHLGVSAGACRYGHASGSQRSQSSHSKAGHPQKSSSVHCIQPHLMAI